MSDFEKERNKQLIKEREEYEKQFFEGIVDTVVETDAFDELIAQRFEYIDEHFDFEPSPAYERLEEIYAYNYERQFDEIDPFDKIEGIDYPEGPDENLNGVDFGEKYHEALIDNEMHIHEQLLEEFEQYEEYPDEILQDNIVDNIIEEQNENDEYMEELIQEHLDEEKNYLNGILMDAMLEENLFEKAIDELIFNEIGRDYKPEYFDYTNNQTIPETPVIMEKNELNENQEKVEKVFKEYFTKDDTLDKIIKQKLKEKKFKRSN